MTNSEIANHLISQGLSEDFSKQAAELISKQQDEIQQAKATYFLTTDNQEIDLQELLENVVNLYELEGETALEILKGMLI